MNELRERALRALLTLAEDDGVDAPDRVAAASQVIYGTSDDTEAIDKIAAGVVERIRAED